MRRGRYYHGRTSDGKLVAQCHFCRNDLVPVPYQRHFAFSCAMTMSKLRNDGALVTTMSCRIGAKRFCRYLMSVMILFGVVPGCVTNTQLLADNYPCCVAGSKERLNSEFPCPSSRWIDSVAEHPPRSSVGLPLDRLYGRHQGCGRRGFITSRALIKSCVQQTSCRTRINSSTRFTSLTVEACVFRVLNLPVISAASWFKSCQDGGHCELLIARLQGPSATQD